MIYQIVQRKLYTGSRSTALVILLSGTVLSLGNTKAEAQYVKTTVASFSTASGTYTDVTGATLSFTPSSDSEVWILLFSARLRSTSTNEQTVEARYLVNTIEHGMGGIQTRRSFAPGSWQHFYRVTNTTALQTVQVQLSDVGGGTATIEDLQMIGFRLPDNADFRYAETNGDQPFTDTAVWTTRQSLDFTPPADGDYLVMAVDNGQEFPGDNGIDIRVQDPSGSFWPVSDGTAQPYFHNPRDPWESFFAARVQSLTGGVFQTYEIQAYQSHVSGATVRDTRIMAFRTDAFDNDVESVENLAETSTNSTTPVLKSTLTTTAPPSARDYIVVQSLFLKNLDSDSDILMEAVQERHGRSDELRTLVQRQ